MRIGICGRTGCGKSTVASLLSTKLGFPVLHLDDYFTTPSGSIFGYPNYERIDSYDIDKLVEDTRSYKDVIVEGFLLHLDRRLVCILEKRVVLLVSDECLIQRRLSRHDRKSDREDYLRRVVLPESRMSDPTRGFRPHLVLESEVPVKELVLKILEYIKGV